MEGVGTGRVVVMGRAQGEGGVRMRGRESGSGSERGRINRRERIMVRVRVWVRYGLEPGQTKGASHQGVGGTRG